jgi:hypothetical protein
MYTAAVARALPIDTLFRPTDLRTRLQPKLTFGTRPFESESTDRELATHKLFFCIISLLLNWAAERLAPELNVCRSDLDK